MTRRVSAEVYPIAPPMEVAVASGLAATMPTIFTSNPPLMTVFSALPVSLRRSL